MMLGEFPGMKPGMELKGEDNEEACPDSWELADLEESMKRLVPAGSGGLGGGGVDQEGAGGGGGEDSSQIDEFLREALQNPHDRMTILRLEHDVERFVKNPKQHQLEFPPMASSYMRLAAHRVAQHYYLVTSVIDSTVEGCRIIVRKSGENKFPSIRLADIPVATEGGGNLNTKFVIKQRPQASCSSGGDSGAANGSGSNSSKSVEERNEEYNRARARIFRHEQEQRAYDELLEVEGRKLTKFPEVSSSSEHGKQRNHSSSSVSYCGGGGNTSGNCSNSNINSSGSSTTTSGGIATKAADKDPSKDPSNKSRQKVAIFRDREKDRKDPDYDRNYDRYSQRFDPGFGLNQPPGFGMQARYTPVVNYNTEFPQLGCPPVRQMPPPPPPPPQAAAQPGWRHAYQHQDMMRAPPAPPFNPPPPRVTPHSTMATYMSQYPYPRPSMAYHYPSQVSQPEAGSTQARRH